MKMARWVKKEWDSLTDVEKWELKTDSQVIVDHVMRPTVCRVALDKIAKVFIRFPFTAADILPVYEEVRSADYNKVPYSEMKCLLCYFDQFAKSDAKEPAVECIKKPVVKRVTSVTIGSKMLVHNDFYGDIVVEVTNITDTSYVVQYKKGRVLYIKSWRIPIDSPRILNKTVE